MYLCRDPNLDILVALKVLHAEHKTDELTDRFRIEAQTNVRLTHNNIVRIYNFNPQVPYLVMEYCRDGDLKRYIKSRRPLSLARSLSIVKQICEALVAAHEHEPQILHRDVKPANVLFQKDVPKVSDFGLAKMIGANSGLTTTRGMMGTVHYASPEQLRDASKADCRTDIWGIGATLYELLTFQRPFGKSGDDYVNIALKVRMEPPAVPSFELPQPIREIIDRALRKDPEERFSSAAEMSQALDRAIALFPQAEQMMFPPPAALADADRLAAQVADVLDQGSTVQAEGLIEKLRAQSSDESLVPYWSHALRQARELESDSGSGAYVEVGEVRQARWLEERLHSIQSMIQSYRFQRATQEVAKVLVEDPDNTVVQRYFTRINERRKELTDAINAAQEQSEQAKQAGDVESNVRIWSAVAARFSGHPDIETNLSEAKRLEQLERKRHERENTARAAERLRDMGDFDGALAVWDDYLRQNPDDVKASSARRELDDQRRSKVMADRIEDLSKQSVLLKQAGKLKEALALWDALLREFPGAEGALQQRESIVEAIETESRAKLLKQTQDRTAALQEAGDHREALALWQRFLVKAPDCEEAVQQIEALRQTVIDQETAAISHAIRRHTSVLEKALEQGSFKALTGVRAQVAAALEAGKGAGGGQLETLRSTLGSLVAARKAASEAMADLLAGRRVQTRKVVEEAKELITSAAPVGESLEQALREAVCALIAAPPDDFTSDPVQTLALAEEKLKQAIEDAVRHRSDALAAARDRATTGLAAAESAVAAIPESVDSTETGELREEFNLLRQALESKSPSRLSEIYSNTAAIVARAEGITAREWIRASTDLQEAVLNALELMSVVQDPSLSELARTGARLLEDSDAGIPQAVELTVALRQRSAAVREQNEAGGKRSRESWEQALEEWSAIAGDGIDADLSGRFEALRESGEASRSAARYVTLAGKTKELVALTRQAGVTSAWSKHRSVLNDAEASEAASIATGPGRAKQVEKLLREYRQGVANGATTELTALARDLAQATREQPGGGKNRKIKLLDIPEVPKNVRRFNQRFQVPALERFDRATSEYSRAREQRDHAELAALGPEVERQYAALLQPVRRPLRAVGYGATIVLLLGALTGGLWAMTRTPDTTLFLVTVAEEIQVSRLLRNNEPVAIPDDGRVTTAGVRWTLKPGDYELFAAGGQKIGSFSVPGPPVVLNPTSDVDDELVRELGLGSLLAGESE